MNSYIGCKWLQKAHLDSALVWNTALGLLLPSSLLALRTTVVTLSMAHRLFESKDSREQAKDFLVLILLIC